MFLQHYDSRTFACSKGKICSFHGSVYLCVNWQPWEVRVNLGVGVWSRLCESAKPLRISRDNTAKRRVKQEVLALLTFCEHSNSPEWFIGIPLQEENCKLTVYTKKLLVLINQGNGIFDYTESLSYLSYFVHSLPRNMSFSFLFPNSVTYRMDENCRKRYLLVLSKVSLIYNPHSGAKKDKSNSPHTNPMSVHITKSEQCHSCQEWVLRCISH